MVGVIAPQILCKLKHFLIVGAHNISKVIIYQSKGGGAWRRTHVHLALQKYNFFKKCYNENLLHEPSLYAQ